MLIEVRTDGNLQGSERFSDEVKTVVQTALGRFGDRIADDALEAARRPAPGSQRSEAFKKAGFLRRIADNHGVISLQGGLRKVRKA